MKAIPLLGGGCAWVDDGDFDSLSKFKWRPLRLERVGKPLIYAERSNKQNNPHNVRMHRQIMMPPPSATVDHVDGYGLMNIRSNLRIASRRENQRNAHRSKNMNRGGFKGVCWVTREKKWLATIRAGGILPCGRRRLMFLGYFADPAAGARAYDAAALVHFGAFAALNFPI